MRMLFIVAAALTVAGCDPVDTYIANVAAKQKVQQVREIENKIGELNSALNSKSLEIGALNSKLSTLETLININTSLLSSFDEGQASVREGGSYGIVKTRHGIFLASINKIEPYLDGYRVTFSVGNPTNMTFHGGEFKVGWGLPWGTKDKKFAEINASRRSKIFSIVQDFLPGSYTAVSLALTPAKPDEIKLIDVGISWNRISLRQSPSQ